MKSTERLCWSAGLLMAIVFLIGGCTEGNRQPANGSQADDSVGSARASKSAPVTTLLPPTARLSTITIKDMKFNPEDLTIRKGDTVMWINNDLTNHCVTEVSKKWTSLTIVPGSAWKRVVSENTDYFCAIHMVMKGRIKVK